MFRCVARLRTQQPHIPWYAAFGSDAPYISHIIRIIQRRHGPAIRIIPWTLYTPPVIPHVDDSDITVMRTIGSHPLLPEIFMHRANEAHYLRDAHPYHGQRQTIYVGDAHIVIPGVEYRQLSDVVTHAAQHPSDMILQPLVLNQHDTLMHALIQQTARGMPLERFGIGRAVEYDRRLLVIIDDLARAHDTSNM